jgi:hypothetical protein
MIKKWADWENLVPNLLFFCQIDLFNLEVYCTDLFNLAGIYFKRMVIKIEKQTSYVENQI